MARYSRSGNYIHERANLRVLVDMDGVLCDFESCLLEEFRRLYPDEPYIPLEQRKCFYVRRQYGDLRSDLEDKVCGIYNSEGFILNLVEIPGAVEAVKEMNEMEGVDVFICTSPLNVYEHCLKEKFQWVERHLGKEWVAKLILTKDKTMVNGHLLIDDRTIIKGVVNRPTWQHVLFSACHNLTFELRDGKRRLENWTDGSWRDLIRDFQRRI